MNIPVSEIRPPENTAPGANSHKSQNGEKMLNLTMHPATPEQLAAGVVDPAPEVREKIARLLTFEAIDEADSREMNARARRLAEIAANEGHFRAMIGGAPFFMRRLELALRERDVSPLFAFSKRESVEKTLPDGSVQKVSVFRHAGFVSS